MADLDAMVEAGAEALLDGSPFAPSFPHEYHSNVCTADVDAVARAVLEGAGVPALLAGRAEGIPAADRGAADTAPELDPWREKALHYGPGVHVSRPGDRGGGYDVEEDEWGVFLPHSCDEWVIAAHVDRGEAVAQLDRFIAALRHAREKLARD